MESQDTCCTFVPYFKIQEGKLNEARALCDKFVEKTREEAKVMFYGFTFDADLLHCREGYQEADGVLAHRENVGELFKEALKIADLTRLEVHGPAREVEKLRGPLAELKPQFFTQIKLDGLSCPRVDKQSRNKQLGISILLAKGPKRSDLPPSVVTTV
jgi:hypothetical protein